MAVFGGANLGISFSSHLFDQHSCFHSCPLKLLPSSSSSSSSSHRNSLLCVVKSFSGSATADTDRNSDQSSVLSASDSLLRDTSDDAGPTRISSDWKMAKAYCKSGDTFEGEVEGFNGGGLLIRFHSLVGFLPYPQLSPSRSCKGLYHLTGLVHVSEVSWDYVQDVRDVLRDGDEVRVIVTNIDKEKSRITLSIKQLEDDPLLETLDKVILKDSSTGSPSLSSNNGDAIEPLPGLETILKELLQEDGIEAVKINRQGFEKRVVSQDLQLWLSNTPPSEGKFVLLARAGRQVQEIHLTTSLYQQGIKKALQRVLERVP